MDILLKRIIALVLSITIFVPCIQIKAESSTSNIIVNEVFDDYALNSKPDSSVVALSGTNERVVFGRKNDKALYDKLDGSYLSVSIPLETTEKKMVYSFDMMIKGAMISGDILKHGNNSFIKLNNDGKMRLPDNRYIGGYPNGMWHTYTVSVDYASQKYSLYIDGKLQLKNRILNVDLSVPASMDFKFVSVEENKITEIYLDNIRVYTGDRILKEKEFPKKTANNEIRDFFEIEKITPEDKIFIDSYSTEGINAQITRHGSTVDIQSIEENGVPYYHFIHSGTTGPYIDLTTGISETEEKYVYQVEVYPQKLTKSSVILGRAINSVTGYSNLLYLSKTGVLTSNDVKCGTLPVGEWSRVAIACNLSMGTADVYINDVLVAGKISLHNGGVSPEKIRIGFETSSASTVNEVYFNAVKLYRGTSIKKFDDSKRHERMISQNSADSEYRYGGESSGAAINIIGNDSVFMTSCDSLFIDGEKHKYQDYGASAFEDSTGVIMVPVKLLQKALGDEIKCSDNIIEANGIKFTAGNATSGEITLDSPPELISGEYFVPCVSYVKNVLGKYAYNDGRGFAIVSNSNRTYSNSDIVTDNVEEVDVVYRFMQYERPSGEQIYKDIKEHSASMHPRMFIRADEIPAFREMIDRNDDLKNELALLLVACEKYLEQDVEPYKFTQSEGQRLFGAFNRIRELIIDLSVAYYATGEERYLERIWRECENVLNWEHWNLSGSFLDSGELGPGIALAYDVLYNWMNDEQKEFFRDKIQEKYLDYVVGVYTGSSGFNVNDGRMQHSNWGAVCGASMFLTAMAFIDDEPDGSVLTEKCKFIAASALQALEFPFGTLYPDGAILEGLDYWTYYIDNLTWSVNALINMCGSDYGLLSTRGYKEAIKYGLNIQTANGGFNYATTPDESIHLTPELMGIANLYDDMVSMEALKTYFEVTDTEFGARGLLFYKKSDKEANLSDMPLDNVFPGLQISTMRSSYDNTTASYVAVLGGKNGTSSHFDKGSFIYEVGGVRWISDMGHERKDVSGGYYHKEGWNLYRKRTEGHNNLVINPYGADKVNDYISYGSLNPANNADPGYIGQTIDSYASVIKTVSKPRGAISVYDLTDVYGNSVKSYLRGFKLGSNRHTMIMQDEVEFSENNLNDNAIYWYLHTKDSTVSIIDNNHAVIEKDGKKLHIEILCDAKDYKLEVWDAEPLDRALIRTGEKKEYSRKAYKKLALTGKADTKLNITTRFYLEDGNIYDELSFEPISEWSIPDGEIEGEAELTALYCNGEAVDGFRSAKTTYKLKMFAQGKLPFISAETNDDCIVEIQQVQGFADAAYIYVTGKTGRKNTYIVEFEYVEQVVDKLIASTPCAGLPDNITLITSKTVSASHIPQEEHIPVNTQDGDFVSRWTSDTSGASLTLDLGEVKALEGIAIAFYSGDSRTYIYDLLVSDDGFTYYRIADGAKSTGKTSEYEWTKANVNARYIKLVGYGHSAGEWNNVSELRAGILR